jgi:hypothetical protein
MNLHHLLNSLPLNHSCLWWKPSALTRLVIVFTTKSWLHFEIQPLHAGQDRLHALDYNFLTLECLIYNLVKSGVFTQYTLSVLHYQQMNISFKFTHPPPPEAPSRLLVNVINYQWPSRLTILNSRLKMPHRPKWKLCSLNAQYFKRIIIYE